MTPREALYHLVIELGPVPQTTRNDNLSPKEIRLRDSVAVLQDLIQKTAEDTETRHLSEDRLVADLKDLYCNEASKH
jgi:hypothetical protein